MTRAFTGAIVAVVLAVVYVVLQVGYVRPHLWPAGDGTRIGTTLAVVMMGRPPSIDPKALALAEVLPESPAEAAGLRPGDVYREIVNVRTRERVDARDFLMADAADRLRAWRGAYRMGVRDPLRVVMHRPSEDREVTASVLRPAAWRLPRSIHTLWAKVHISDLLQMVVFVTLSLVLLALRATEPTGALAVLALTLCAVAAGGPTLGGEYLLPQPLPHLMTIFSWTATPLAFVATTFAIGYFPRKSPLLVRHPVLFALPFLITAPMLVVGASAGLFLAGVDAVLPILTWDAANPSLFYVSFALAVAMNLGVVTEGVFRFRANVDQNERRRVAISVLTIVPGVVAFALKDGIPNLGFLLGRPLMLPWWLTLALQIVVLLPAFGLTYAVIVHRVFAPATVLRRSVQYALARKTLALLAALPATALVLTLIENRDMSISSLVTGRPMFDVIMIGALIATIRYRDRARLWLDRRFFREAYDAREILLSLASRLTYETDPSDLTAMVAERIDMALHPEMVAVLVGGVDAGQLRPISTLHTDVPPLAMDSGLVTMLRWSNEPLELYVKDERSPAGRLPPAEQAWLRRTSAVLFVPVVSRGSDATVRHTPDSHSSPTPSGLIAVIALGARRSEEPYTAEDRQLLASIAAQVSLALDVARLRQRVEPADAAPTVLPPAAAATSDAGIAECPQCGRCAAIGTATCPDDGTAMRTVAGVPHVIDRKYRVDRVLGRGGMGAVYCARDVRLDRDVAIKVVRADLLDHAEARARFRREAQIVARLQHPGIVSIFDYGTFADGAAFLVMELVWGEDLRRVLRREGSIPPPRALPILGATCAAVHAAHRDGVLHRDLKPENILLVDGRPALAPDDVNATMLDTAVKVLDFGVAKLVSDRPAEATALGTLTGAGLILGTPAYMAPEQLRNQGIDARTDVFSLGVIAYEMLTGELPFGRVSVWDIGLRHAEGVRPMQTPGFDVPPHVADAVGRALRLDPAQRPASAAEFSALLTSPAV